MGGRIGRARSRAKGRRALAAALCWSGLLLVVPWGHAAARPSAHPFEVVPGSFGVEPAAKQAGAHADVSISVDFAHDESGHTFNDLRTALFELPAGMAGTAQSTPACTQAEFLSGDESPACPPGSQVGTVEFKESTLSFSLGAKLPIYNLVPPEPGLPAELGFRYAAFVQRLPLGVRSEDGGLDVEVRDVALNVEPHELMIDIWGVPAAAEHDAERGTYCLSLGEELTCGGNPEAAGVPPRAFLTNPTRCGPAPVTLRAVSWEEPGVVARADAEAGPISDCEGLEFNPRLRVAATSTAAESPSGFSIALEMPGDGSDPDTRSPSALRSARIALPEGFSLNPAAAAGYSACSSSQLARETATSAPGAGCPPASVIGSVEARTPSLREPVKGSLYLAEPFANPTGAQIAFYAVAKAPSAGAQIKLLARLGTDPRSGRSSVVVEDVPQLPLTLLGISLGVDGSTPLVTAATCGAAATTAELTPWSAPGKSRRLESSVRLDQAAGGGPCQPAADRPFRPALSVSSARPQAGVPSPLRLRIARDDGELQLGRLSFRLPRGLSAALADVEACPEAVLDAVGGRSGISERDDPSCPQAALLGRTSIEVGAGPSPVGLAGRAYLAGPFADSSLSVALVTPALLGPFDFGTTIVREGLRLDPRTGAIVLDSGAGRLPTALGGLSFRLRGLTIDLDRPGFVRNPTNCRDLRASAAAEGYGQGEARAVGLSSPYRVTGCRRLRFAPLLRLDLLGTTARNGHPGLRLTFISHPDEANLASAGIGLPDGLLLDPTRIGATCGARQLDARACPAGSVVGRARAISPLLGEPLRGHVFLRRNPRSQLPDLVTDLHSEKADLQITARPRLTRSGLEVVTTPLPDVPIAKFQVVLVGGHRGLLVHSREFCQKPGGFEVEMVAQNGKARALRTRTPRQCLLRYRSRQAR